MALTCRDVHEFRRIGDNAHTWQESFPVWSAETSIPAATNSSTGLPFRFKLPASVGPETSPSGIVSGKGNQSRMTIHVPGMRQVAHAENSPPIARRWLLEVSAATAGPDLKWEFEVDVRG